MADDDSLFGQEEDEEPQLPLRNQLFGFLRKKKRKTVQNQQQESYYGVDDGSLDESPYGVSTEEYKETPEPSSGWNPYGFSWWEWVIIGTELALVVYTLLVFIGIAPLF